MRLPFKIRNILVAVGMIILSFYSGCGTEAPAGAKIEMPPDATIEASGDVIFYIDAMVTNSNGAPMNGIDVEFLVCCAGAFIDYNNETYIKVRTDDRGIARVRVLIPGQFEGEIIVSGTIGVAGDQTKITKKLPQAQ